MQYIMTVCNPYILQISFNAIQELNLASNETSIKSKVIGVALGATRGSISGHAVFRSADAVSYNKMGKPCILIRDETSPDDMVGILACSGVLTMHGGQTSYAAVQARVYNKCAIVNGSLSGLTIDNDTQTVSFKGNVVISKDQV
jgi:pyruvate,orthophosphate dikinase